MNARKPLHLVLESADLAHVIDPLGDGLDVPVHHRRRRRDPEPVGLAHHAEPLLGLRLLRRDDVAHPVDKDLAAAARDRIEPASRSRVNVSGIVSFDRREMCWISGGDSACRWIG